MKSVQFRQRDESPSPERPPVFNIRQLKTIDISFGLISLASTFRRTIVVLIDPDQYLLQSDSPERHNVDIGPLRVLPRPVENEYQVDILLTATRPGRNVLQASLKLICKDSGEETRTIRLRVHYHALCLAQGKPVLHNGVQEMIRRHEESNSSASEADTGQ